jgi:hypothetical protein
VNSQKLKAGGETVFPEEEEDIEPEEEEWEEED